MQSEMNKHVQLQHGIGTVFGSMCNLVKITIMKHRILLLLAAFLVSGSVASAQSPSKAVSIFDGKTLNGWNFDPAIWRVEDRMMVGGSTTEKIRKNYFIATDKSCQNFELKLKIRCSGDPKTGFINSGIQIRSLRVPGGAPMAGYQVDCGDRWFGKIYDEFRRKAVIADQVHRGGVEAATSGPSSPPTPSPRTGHSSTTAATNWSPRGPVAWAWKNEWGGKSFYTSFGHPGDFAEAYFNRMLINAICWSVEHPLPAKDARINTWQIERVDKKKRPARK
jgi:hypothetical protein